MVDHTIKKGNVKLTLSVNKKILTKFKKFCGKRGLIISKQIENFMREKVENGGN